MPYKILLAEDDPILRNELKVLLENAMYQVVAPDTFDRIPQTAADEKADLVLLDINLNGASGFDICTQLRQSSDTPVIFLTGRTDSMDELNGILKGGDDYITKPYHIPVLLARIHTVLRRTSPKQESDRLEDKGLTVSLSQGMASSGGTTVELTRNELRILAHLMQHAGEIVSRADLIDVLWDNHIYIDDNTLSVNMTRLRGKLEELGLPDYIKTRRGLGYQV